MHEAYVCDIRTSVDPSNNVPVRAILSTADLPSGESSSRPQRAGCSKAVNYLHHAARTYCERGLPITLCRPGSNEPFGTEQPHHTWTMRSIDSLFAIHATANVGLLLGPSTGLVCIVCDGEAAEEKFNELFAGDVIHTPTWRSKRRLHRLFKWHPALEQLGKNMIVFGDDGAKLDVLIESATPTLLPPSWSGGVRLEWVMGQALAPATLPDSVLKKLGCVLVNDYCFVTK